MMTIGLQYEDGTYTVASIHELGTLPKFVASYKELGRHPRFFQHDPSKPDDGSGEYVPHYIEVPYSVVRND